MNSSFTVPRTERDVIIVHMKDGYSAGLLTFYAAEAITITTVGFSHVSIHGKLYALHCIVNYIMSNITL